MANKIFFKMLYFLHEFSFDFFEKFNISGNNIMSVEAAKVVAGYFNFLFLHSSCSVVLLSLQ